MFAIALACLLLVEGDFCGFCLVSSDQSTGFYLEQSTLLRCIFFSAGKCHPRNRNVFEVFFSKAFAFVSTISRTRQFWCSDVACR